jgi:undecaprenol kinase/diacylglycerol kinase (ATP)
MKFIASFKHAFNGIKSAVCLEQNFKVEFILGLISILLALAFRINTIEWIIIILCNALVLSLELLNTAIEKVCNFFHPGIHPQIKIIKDVAAGAVLIAAIASMVIAIIIFLPKIILFFKSYL